MTDAIGDLQRCSAVLISFLLVISTVVGEGRASSVKVQSLGTVKGTVMDANGAVIVMPKPTIIFEGNNNLKEVVADDNGGYEITLSPGVYRVSTEIVGFYPLRRGRLRVLPGSVLVINLTPKPVYLVRGTTVSTDKAIDAPAPQPKYDEFCVPTSEAQPVDLLIQFDQKRTVRGRVEYHWAVLSYDELTIYSEKLSINKKDLRLRASGGRVIVEDGRQRVQVQEAIVSFKGGEPVVSLTR